MGILPSSLVVNLVHTPSAGIQRGGRVGLSSVPHGKLVAYKIENFNYVNVAFISYKLTMWD